MTRLSVKCADCGFLTLRKLTTRELVEVEEEIRATGEILADPAFVHKPTPMYEPHLLCFRKSFRLHEEQCQPVLGSSLEQRTLAVIHNQRFCDRFTSWEHGYSPREHWEMIQEAERLKWQAQRDKQAQDFQADQAMQSRRHQNRSLAVSVVAVTVAIVALVANTAFNLLKPPSTIVVNPAITIPQAVSGEPKQLPAPPVSAKAAAPAK
jgi:hypothetical protein